MAPIRSLDALSAHAERAEQGLLAMERDLAGRVLTARDDHGVVEISVDSSGAVVEVALDAAVVSRMDPATLAHAVLGAARAAQHDARRLVAERRAYYLDTEKGRSA